MIHLSLIKDKIITKMDHILSDSDSLFYIFFSFNKTELDKNDLKILFNLGYCVNCLIELSKKKLNHNEIKYIESKDWDKFESTYHMRLNECNCKKCSCGFNKSIEVIYDLFEYQDKYPIYTLVCHKCDNMKLKIPKCPNIDFVSNKKLKLNDKNKEFNIINKSIINNNEITC